MLQSEIEQELASNKVFMQGLDKQGRQILVLKTNRHSKSLRDLKQCMRNLCYCLDKAINAADTTRNPDGKIAGIFDLRSKISLPSQSNGSFCSDMCQ